MIAKPARAFTRAVAKLDRVEQILVFKSVERIKIGGGDIGKRLAGPLHDCFSLRTGHGGRLRIVFKLKSFQILRLLTVGPREQGMVYIQALQVLKELER